MHAIETLRLGYDTVLTRIGALPGLEGRLREAVRDHVRAELLRVKGFEESVLLPALEDAAPVLGAAAAGASRELTYEVVRLLEAFASTPGDDARLQERADALRTIVEASRDCNESVVYPLAEKVLGEEGLRSLDAQMRARAPEKSGG